MTLPFDLFTVPPFDGKTYEHEKDHGRLAAQLKRVRELMADEHWRTLAEISAAVGDPEASVSARLRDLRKGKWGAYTVERRRRGVDVRGLFEYRVLPPVKQAGAA